MPPYYFDVWEAAGLTLDDEGIELRDIVHPQNGFVDRRDCPVACSIAAPEREATQPNSLANLTPAVRCHFGSAPYADRLCIGKRRHFLATSL